MFVWAKEMCVRGRTALLLIHFPSLWHYRAYRTRKCVMHNWKTSFMLNNVVVGVAAVNDCTQLHSLFLPVSARLYVAPCRALSANTYTLVTLIGKFHFSMDFRSPHLHVPASLQFCGVGRTPKADVE